MSIERHHLDRRIHDIASRYSAGNDDELLTTVQVADWFGVSPEWLEAGRRLNYGPKYMRLSPRNTRYRRSDVKAWLNERANAVQRKSA